MSDQPEPPVIATREGELLRLVVNRPGRANALDGSAMRSLLHALDTSGEQRPGAIVISGSGKHFCSGVDLGAINEEPVVALELFFDVLIGLLAFPRPVIAAINGQAVGMGWLLAACCDQRIAASDSSFQLPELALGIPSFAAVDLFVNTLPPAMVSSCLVAGDRIESLALADVGWLDDRCEPENLASRNPAS